MLSDHFASNTVQNLTNIIHNLQLEPAIEMAILSTEDGIPLNVDLAQADKVAAVAGFMLAAAHQSFAMLGIVTGKEVIIYSEDEQLLVSHLFQVNESYLILTILFSQKVHYKRLIAQVVRAVRQTMEI